MNPLHQHAQELDGAFTAIGRRLDACENVDQIHAYLNELEAEIIERPYGTRCTNTLSSLPTSA
jgi:hypothetical protein